MGIKLYLHTVDHNVPKLQVLLYLATYDEQCHAQALLLGLSSVMALLYCLNKKFP